jgi:hypothetical protein
MLWYELSDKRLFVKEEENVGREAMIYHRCQANGTALASPRSVTYLTLRGAPSLHWRIRPAWDPHGETWASKLGLR